MNAARLKKVLIIAIAAIAAPIAVIVVNNTTSVTSVPPESSRSEFIQDEAPPYIRDNENTKSFLIGYTLAIEKETANKVGINDYPWLSKIVRNGEVIISNEELREFVSKYNDNPDFAILMEDGTTTYMNINWNQMDLAPNTPYVKAYWINELPGDAVSQRITASEVPALKEAFENKSIWIPLEDPDQVKEVENFLQNMNTRYFEAELDDGTAELYHIRYIDVSQKEISG
jgi:hypothetical protein